MSEIKKIFTLREFNEMLIFAKVVGLKKGGRMYILLDCAVEKMLEVRLSDVCIVDLIEMFPECEREEMLDSVGALWNLTRFHKTMPKCRGEEFVERMRIELNRKGVINA